MIMSLGFSRLLQNDDYNDILCSLTDFLSLNYQE